MSTIVFAAPADAPPPEVPPLVGLQVLWTSWDGTMVWDLTDPAGGVYLTDAAQEGLHLPEFEDYTAEAAGLDGQVYRGGRTKARKVELQVAVFSDSSEGWLALNRAWIKSHHPRKPGTLTVVAGDQTRTLRCRLTSDGGFAHPHDPSRYGWSEYPLSLIADQPFYVGLPITGAWGRTASDQRPFIDPATGGPPFYISNGRTFESATIKNPGDEDTWVRWTAHGPIASAQITVDGGTIGIPAVAAGATLVIYTDPQDGTAWLDGVDVSGQIVPWDPAPLPPGEAVPLGLIVSGNGRLELYAETRYWTALS